MSESNLISVQDCEVLVKKCLQTETATIKNWVVQQFHEQNFGIKIVVSDGNQEKTLQFFATPKIHQIVSTDAIAKPCHENRKFHFFEDLKRRGFRTIESQREVFTLIHVKVVLKVLAKLHAASFIFEAKKSTTNKGEYKLDHDHDHFWINNNEIKEVITWIESNDNLLKILHELDDKQKSPDLIRTLCHGCLSVENIFFKYEKDLPVDCKLINFNQKKYAPPICDILQVIFFNTNEDLRQHHLDNLLSFYYNCLTEELNGSNLDVAEILPLEDFQLSNYHLLPLIKLQTSLHQKGTKNEFVAVLQQIQDCPLLSKEDCFVIIKNILQHTNYDLVSFAVTPLNQANGFLGEYHFLEIKIIHQSQPQALKCFLKRTPSKTATKQIVKDSDGFSKEVFVYETLASRFRDVGINCFDQCLAKCYFQRPDDIMVFEDLSSQNFHSISCQKPHDFELLCLTVKKLAHFHGSAFVYEEKMSEKLGRPYRLNEEFGKYFVESMIVASDAHSGGRFTMNSIKSVKEAVNLLPEIQTEKNKRNFEKMWPKLTDPYFDLIKTSDQHRNILVHGDLWSSNIMILFRDDKAVDCRFIDFQFLRYCPPSQDLLSILHITTDRDTRLKYEPAIVRLYYEELGKLMKSYQYDVKNIFSYDELLRSIEHMRPQMIVQAVVYAMFIFCPPEDFASVVPDDEAWSRIFFGDRRDFLKQMIEKSAYYKKALTDVILDVYDFCNAMETSTNCKI